MKRARRRRALDELYRQLDSADFEDREFALFQLALMLRQAGEVRESADDAFGERHSLPRELQRLRLKVDEQREAAGRLQALFERHKQSRASAIWALRHAPPRIALAPLLDLGDAWGAQLSDEAASQFCRGLRSMLATGAIRPEERQRLAKPGFMQRLQTWSRARDRRLARAATALLAGLRELDG